MTKKPRFYVDDEAFSREQLDRDNPSPIIIKSVLNGEEPVYNYQKLYGGRSKWEYREEELMKPKEFWKERVKILLAKIDGYRGNISAYLNQIKEEQSRIMEAVQNLSSQSYTEAIIALLEEEKDEPAD